MSRSRGRAADGRSYEEQLIKGVLAAVPPDVRSALQLDGAPRDVYVRFVRGGEGWHLDVVSGRHDRPEPTDPVIGRGPCAPLGQSVRVAEVLWRSLGLRAYYLRPEGVGIDETYRTTVFWKGAAR